MARPDAARRGAGVAAKRVRGGDADGVTRGGAGVPDVACVAADR